MCDMRNSFKLFTNIMRYYSEKKTLMNCLENPFEISGIDRKNLAILASGIIIQG